MCNGSGKKQMIISYLKEPRKNLERGRFEMLPNGDRIVPDFLNFPIEIKKLGFEELLSEAT